MTKRLKLLAAAGLALMLVGCKQGPYQPEIVTPEQAQAYIKRGEPVTIADVRSATSYKREHIEGAVHFPYAEVLANARIKGETKLTLPKEHWILLYCT